MVTQESIIEANMSNLNDHLEAMKYIGKLVNNSYYESSMEHMLQVMKVSREPDLLKDPLVHLGYQKALVAVLEELEPLITTGRKLAKSDENDVENLKETADINKMLAGGYREVADGLAWRTLAHNRVRIRILSQSQTPGFIATPQGAKAGRKAELKYADNVAGNNCFVLVHDITSYLLVGDLSMIKTIGEVPHLADAKSKKLTAPASIMRKLDKHAAISKQEGRLLQAQIMLEEDKVISGKEEAPTYHFSSPVVHFHDEVRSMLAEARKTGFAAKEVAGYLVVEVTDIKNPKLAFEKMKQGSLLKKGSSALPFSNFDSIAVKLEGKVMRTKPPYSVYPYSDEDVTALITGELYMHAELDIDALKEVFASLGWEMLIDIPDDIQPASEADIFGGEELFTKMTEDELFIKMTHVESGFVVMLGMDWLSKIGYEMLSAEALLAPLEERRKQVIAGNKSVRGFSYIVNDEEDKIWQ